MRPEVVDEVTAAGIFAPLVLEDRVIAQLYTFGRLEGLVERALLRSGNSQRFCRRKRIPGPLLLTMPSSSLLHAPSASARMAQLKSPFRYLSVQLTRSPLNAVCPKAHRKVLDDIGYLRHASVFTGRIIYSAEYNTSLYRHTLDNQSRYRRVPENPIYTEITPQTNICDVLPVIYL